MGPQPSQPQTAELFRPRLDELLNMQHPLIRLIKRASCEQVILDTTVMPKAIAHPTDSRLLETARSKLVEAALFGNELDDGQIVMGVPKDVFARIKSKAERDWPDNYGMQKYCIESEIKDYQALRSMNAQHGGVVP